MKICFVGLHNKPGKKALDSSTRSGKVVDSIIERLPGIECEKKNLFQTEVMPPIGLRFLLASEFEIDSDTIYVLLGKSVQRYLKPCDEKYIHVAHPAYAMRKGIVGNYIQDVADQITAFQFNC